MQSNAHQSGTVRRQQVVLFTEEDGPMCAFGQVTGHGVLSSGRDVVHTGQETPCLHT